MSSASAHCCKSVVIDQGPQFNYRGVIVVFLYTNHRAYTKTIFISFTFLLYVRPVRTTKTSGCHLSVLQKLYFWRQWEHGAWVGVDWTDFWFSRESVGLVWMEDQTCKKTCKFKFSCLNVDVVSVSKQSGVNPPRWTRCSRSLVYTRWEVADGGWAESPVWSCGRNARTWHTQKHTKKDRQETVIRLSM